MIKTLKQSFCVFYKVMVGVSFAIIYAFIVFLCLGYILAPLSAVPFSYLGLIWNWAIALILLYWLFVPVVYFFNKDEKESEE